MVRTKTKSSVWKLFTKRDNSIFARCNLCHGDYKSSNNTTNLFDHIKRKHPQELFRIKNSDAEEESAADCTSGEDEDGETPRKIRKRNTIKDYSDSDKRKKKIDRAIVNMISIDFQPFSIVENAGFKNLVNVLDNHYEIPSRDILKEKLVPAVYQELKEKLEKTLTEVQSMSITTDIWTSPANEGIITVTCHFIKEGILRSAVLQTTQLIGSHTGVHISEAINNILMDWNIRNKVSAIISDNASNMVLAASLLKIRHIPCFAHVLNLLVQDILKNDSLTPILKQCKDIVAHFRHSTLSGDKLKRKQKEANLETLKLLQETPTRWNSTLYMIQRILDLKRPLTLAITECEKAPIPVNATEMRILEDLCEILKPFEEATKEISGDTYVTLSLILPVIKGISIRLRNTEDKLKSNLGQEILNDCFSRIQSRLNPFESRTHILLSTILDPRMKKIAFRQAEHANNASQLLINELVSEITFQRNATIIKSRKDTPTNNAEDVQGPSTSKGLLSFLDEMVEQKIEGSTPISDAIISVRQYLEKPPIPRMENPISFWENYPCMYLKQVAFKYLSMSATSVPSERVFSKAGLIMTDRRNRIKAKNLDILIFIKCNKWLESDNN